MLLDIYEDLAPLSSFNSQDISDVKLNKFLGQNSPRHYSIPNVESLKMGSGTKHSSQRMIEKAKPEEDDDVINQACKTQQSRYKNNSSNMLRHSFKEEEADLNIIEVPFTPQPGH